MAVLSPSSFSAKPTLPDLYIIAAVCSSRHHDLQPGSHGPGAKRTSSVLPQINQLYQPDQRYTVSDRLLQQLHFCERGTGQINCTDMSEVDSDTLSCDQKWSHFCCGCLDSNVCFMILLNCTVLNMANFASHQKAID